MRTSIIIFLAFLNFRTTGQRIEYRNDSLFVNNIYVDAQTNKETLDRLLNSKSKLKISKSDFRQNPTTGHIVLETTFYYYGLGLYFRKYDYDTTKLSVGIKLYRDSNKKIDRENELTETFQGQLFIAENFINDKRRIEDLEKLQNCTVTVSEATLGSYSTVLGGDIIYKENIIRLSFDQRTNALVEVFIHHNFKDR